VVLDFLGYADFHGAYCTPVKKRARGSHVGLSEGQAIATAFLKSALRLGGLS
jgi:hypothetical protein